MITCVTGQELSMLDSTGEDFSVKIVKLRYSINIYPQKKSRDAFY